MESSSRLLKTQIPPDWTDNPVNMDNDRYWKQPSGEGLPMAKEYGLNVSKIKGIICSSQMSGESMYMFEYEGKYYLWNQIEQSVWQIVSPTNLQDILVEMAKESGSTMKMKELDPAGS
ncbi:hypothetical protein CIHG_01755 [Coccidioides immitis H538.4]|uniref:Uncharacterized protein n=1 Tax=Coccidioides immitis H538.4 TaxID=396776 RepID=A0A0J8RH49_COCIT|nr:hypothetical protein CIHG_01755 [Coccidioides immitis H538.4]